MENYESFPVASFDAYPAGKRELLFGMIIAICALILANSVLFAGFHLGYAIAQGLCILASIVYLWISGRKLRFYSSALLALSLVITAGFARSDDGFVKFVMVCFLFVAVNLGLGLQAGQNRRSSAGVTSLLDAPAVFFQLGFGKLPEAYRGIHDAMRNGPAASKKTGAVLLGALISVPVLVIVVLLLVSADAAFEGLVEKLPNLDVPELVLTVLFGGSAACVLYTRAAALRHAEPKEAEKKYSTGIHPLTVNTVLVMICLVYVVYLFSQLAYFAGGFSGILPKGYTMAEYARRGFFEMGWLCAINLGLIALAVGLVKKTQKTPLSTRLFCLFIGLVTLFFVVTASAKMGMYIGSYGLTRLRVLTEVIMVFLGLATALVCVWLFVPKMAYMKAVLLIALVMCAVVIWADVDTVVARYNVRSYQSGKLDSVDVGYLTSLSAGAVPYIAELAEDGNAQAQKYMERYNSERFWDEDTHDLRSWNWADWLAGQQWDRAK